MITDFKIKNLFMILISIFTFYGCTPANNNEGPPNDTKSICEKEIGYFNHKLKECKLDNDISYSKNIVECNLYDNNHNYSNTELKENEACFNSISALSCDALTTDSKIEDIDTCPTFRDKAKKSKKEVCAENYFLFCVKQLEDCSENALNAECNKAKYIETNNIGKDAHTSFKMDKLLEYCDTESDEYAEINDLDCIAHGNRPITYNVCNTPVFEDFRASCNWFDE